MKKDRLRYLAYLSKDFESITDIGCDHGLLIKYLFQDYNLKYAQAVDNKIEPLNNARKNLEGLNVDFILSNGFENIKKKTELVTICGIGGLNIIKILEKAYETNYLIEAHSNIFELRKYLFNNNFIILDEYTFFENNIYYVIIKAKLDKSSQNNYLENDIYLGNILKTKKENIAYYKFYYNHFLNVEKNIINNMKNNEKNNNLEKIINLKKLFFETIKNLEK